MRWAEYYDRFYDWEESTQLRHLYLEGEWENRWGNGGNFRWKHPWRFLATFLPQNEKAVHVFFNTTPKGENPKGQDADACFERVSWVNPRFTPRWGRFQTTYKPPMNYRELLDWLKTRWERERGGVCS